MITDTQTAYICVAAVCCVWGIGSTIEHVTDRLTGHTEKPEEPEAVNQQEEEQ